MSLHLALLEGISPICKKHRREPEIGTLRPLPEEQNFTPSVVTVVSTCDYVLYVALSKADTGKGYFLANTPLAWQ